LLFGQHKWLNGFKTLIMKTLTMPLLQTLYLTLFTVLSSLFGPLCLLRVGSKSRIGLLIDGWLETLKKCHLIEKSLNQVLIMTLS
jgi:hypothetical protein